MAEIISGLLDMTHIQASEREIAQRLKIPPDYTNDVIDNCTLAVRKSLTPRYCYIKTPVEFIEDNTVAFDFGKVKSADLHKNLCGCKYAYVMAVTLGIDIDRLIVRLSATAKAEAFVADALASAYAEALADEVNRIIGKDVNLRPRFSPGYGDFDLSFQAKILEYLKADKLAGIKLCENYMMTPRKSVTALCGIE